MAEDFPGGPAMAAQIALGEGGSAAEEARDYLRKQSRLTDLQIENLRKLDEYETSHLRWRRFNDQMGGALQMMLVAIGLLIVLSIGAVIWTAAHDNGLVIEAFSVPPDMAARGITGQVVAGQLLDKLAALQDATDSARPAASYSNNWGSDLKIEIPDTGISLGEAWRTLAGWLGHETHITGEVYRTANGLALTARAGGDGAATVSGSDADLDKMLQQVAEAIYLHTQPYRYAAFVEGSAKPDLVRAHAVLQRLSIEGATERERAWATLGLGVNALFSADIPDSAKYYRQAIAMVPGFALAWDDLTDSESDMEHEESSLRAARETLRLIDGRADVDMTPRARAILIPIARANFAAGTGDFGAAARDYRMVATLPDYGGAVESSGESAAWALAQLHDARAAWNAWRGLPSPADSGTADSRASFRVNLDFALADWPGVLKNRTVAEAAFGRSFLRNQLRQVLWPLVARALAETGDIAGAEALIAGTPLDCDLCVRQRGRISALKHDWREAAHWFALVSARTPDIPFADTEWGQMLLAKGDLNGAIAKFDSAHRKGQHFADPLELWGEALIAKNRSDLALAKFAEANNDAPNWGRLHLKWGEALWWSGNRDEARKQFAIAAALDLTASEKSELAKISHGG